LFVGNAVNHDCCTIQQAIRQAIVQIQMYTAIQKCVENIRGNASKWNRKYCIRRLNEFSNRYLNSMEDKS
jgi:hypothetical protein